MHELEFPYGRKRYLCAICGNTSEDEKRIEACEALGMPESTSLRVGDWIILRGVRKMVSDIFYLEPGDRVNPYQEDCDPPHTLAITLREPFRSGDRDGGTSGSYKTLKHSHVVLLQEGDEEKLAAAGLVRSPLMQRTEVGFRVFLRNLWRNLLFPFFTGKSWDEWPR